MLRHKSLPVNEDSDQSISDEDDEVGELAWPENIVSLAGTPNRKKEGPGVVSQLELLKGVHQDTGFSSEDEVEIPDFQDKSNLGGNSISLMRDGSTSEVNEQISDDEKERKMRVNPIITGPTVSETLDLYARGKGKQRELCTGPAVGKDVRRLVRLGENSKCSAHRSMHAKGDRWTTKPASYSIQQDKKGAFWPSDDKGNELGSTTDDDLVDEPDALDYRPMDKSACEILGVSDGEKKSMSGHALPLEAVIQHDHSRHSMVELLDDLRGKNRNLNLKSKMGGRRKGQIEQRAVSRSVSSSSSGNAIISYESPCEILNSGSSTDDEKKAQNLEIAIVEPRRKTMADKFQEAFGSASVDDRRPFTVPKQTSGLFGRLQQVMQLQKEQDTEFLKNFQAEVFPKDEARCIDVKILSRSFDAKLTVCRCSLLDNEESSLANPRQENFGKIWTIIFNSRVCGDVDLEVANFVRVHPPWKEAQVPQGGEIIILATYFTQIYT